MDEKINLAYASIVARAEVHSILEEEDYFITTVDNGIAFFSETNYNTLVEKTLHGFKAYLESQGFDNATIEEELDTFASNLVLHYIDHKAFSDEKILEVRTKYEHLVNSVREETLDVSVEDEDESRL
jgi:hypothetical protein